jgi:hypothetical protein
MVKRCGHTTNRLDIGGKAPSSPHKELAQNLCLGWKFDELFKIWVQDLRQSSIIYRVQLPVGGHKSTSRRITFCLSNRFTGR